MTRAAGDEPRPDHEAMAERRIERLVAALFGIAAMAGVALLVVYAMGGQTQVEGILLTICLGGIGAGVVVWGQRLMVSKVEIEPRGTVGGTVQDSAALTETIAEEAGFTRRTLLVRALGAALAGLGAALAIPILSLGPAPGRSLFTTSWKAGARLAPPGGTPVTSAAVPVGGVLTVFPDGDPSDPNAAALLIHLEPEYVSAPGAVAAGDGTFVVFSKICTHAGCPVGLYRSAQHTLICPCHQSEFDVLAGAHPISGPAARPLPALPVRAEADGTFVATGDYPEPVGPSFWDMDR
jgi:ubiquinol-cytochrome c reductase iron-sulfur subunit